jgi:glucokinase
VADVAHKDYDSGDSTATKIHANVRQEVSVCEHKREIILVADIGGTNARLAIIERMDDRFEFLIEKTFSSREESSLESTLRKFLAAPHPPLTRASLGVAGPVLHNRCEATNLPWVIDAQVIARQLDLPSVGLINDLEAVVYGLLDLDDDDFAVINQGVADPQGNRVVIAAGTGLGEAGLFYSNGEYQTFASEGGHADFAPRNHLEMDLLDYLLRRHTRVSVERVVSGNGILNIYQFLKDKKLLEEPEWLAKQMRQEDSPKVITRNALAGNSALCVEALDIFVSLYGAEAGNLALKLMATGGVYLAGGIAPKILDKIREPIFMNAFTAKGRMKPLLQAMPVQVILNPKVALIGAACHAMAMRR